MCNLFPPPDYPDHRSIPTSLPTEKQSVATVALAGALYGVYPKHEEHEKHHPHTHSEEFDNGSAAVVLAPASRSSDVTVRLTGVSATGSVGVVTARIKAPPEMPPFEPPHTHEEHEDPPPPASHVDVVGSTGAGPDTLGWLGNNSQDVANEIIRRNWKTEKHRRAHYVMAAMSYSMSPALLNFASRQNATSST